MAKTRAAATATARKSSLTRGRCSILGVLGEAVTLAAAVHRTMAGVAVAMESEFTDPSDTRRAQLELGGDAVVLLLNACRRLIASIQACGGPRRFARCLAGAVAVSSLR